jgi:acetyltransferase-like isoleucine patch superfamily enzyme
MPHSDLVPDQQRRFAAPAYRRRLHPVTRLHRRLAWVGLAARIPRLRGQPRADLGPRPIITIGANGSFERGTGILALGELTLSIEGRLRIGSNVFLGRGTHITCFDSVTIGDGARLAERVSIHDENHVMEPLDDVAGRRNDYVVAPVVIGPRVWLGANVVVLSGVTIGADTVVAANSVVTVDLPAGVLAAGAPARVRRVLRSADTGLATSTDL